MAAGSFTSDNNGTVIEIPTATSRANYCTGWRLTPVGVDVVEFRPATTGGSDEDTVQRTAGMKQGWNLEVDWIDDDEQTLYQALQALDGTEATVTLRRRNAAKSVTNPEITGTLIMQSVPNNFTKGDIPRFTVTYQFKTEPAIATA